MGGRPPIRRQGLTGIAVADRVWLRGFCVTGSAVGAGLFLSVAVAVAVVVGGARALCACRLARSGCFGGTG
ncbi:hypothetical protein ACFV8T_34000 [Streptomyces sp. NPDC059832]|uniref:hypothetical protein n=1 Tax=Streptomyces sp. NPDC059832 TaxID=3346966 RepID=UPI003648772F